MSYLRTEIDKIINIKNDLEDIFINYKYIKEVYYHLVEKRLYPDRFNYFTKIYLSICYELIFNKKGKNIKLSYLKKILDCIGNEKIKS